jgi:protein SCO1/2
MSCQKRASEQALPYYNTADFSPIFIDDEQQVNTWVDHTIRNFSLLDEDSAVISQQDVKGKIHVANFIFTSCGNICPAMTSNMKTVSDKFKSNPDIVFLSFTVTPWIDKPHVLKKYKLLHEIDHDNWHFLTGRKSDIYQLARQSYFAEEQLGFTKDSTEFLHTEHFLLIDRDLRIRGIYNGTLRLEMDMLADDIHTLLQEDGS